MASTNPSLQFIILFSGSPKYAMKVIYPDNNGNHWTSFQGWE